MSEQRASTARAAAGTMPAGGKGHLRVGQHVGQTAGQAAQAIRRAGLRPGLERCFGYPEQQLGRVVEQDPPAGTQLTRNGLVRIFVAAPGGESEQEQPEHREVERPVELADTPYEAEVGEPDAPALPDELPWSEAPVEPARKASQSASGEVEDERASAAADGAAPAPSEDELVALAERVFAERMASDARRPWKAHGRGLLEAGRARLTRWRRRSLLVKGAWVMLALWLAVGVLTALLGGHGGAPGADRRPRVVREPSRRREHPTRPGTASSAGSAERARRPARATGRQGAAGGRAHADRSAAEPHRRAAVRQAARLRGAGATAATEPSVLAEVQPSIGAAQSPVVSQPSGPGVVVPAPPEQTGGGPFSP